MGCRKGGFYNPDCEDDPLTTYDLPHTNSDQVCGTCMNWNSSSWHCFYDRADDEDKVELGPNDLCEFAHYHHKW